MPMEMVRALSRAIERNACAEFGLLKIAQFDLDGARVEGEEEGKRLIELAALLDRDIIVHSLLRAGSCISRTPQSSSAATAWQRAQVYPAYVAYVCKKVVRLLQRLGHREEGGAVNTCGACQSRHPPTSMCSWQACDHAVCENCLWQKLLDCTAQEIDCPFATLLLRSRDGSENVSIA